MPISRSIARKFRLRTTLVAPFVLQIVTAVGLVGYFSFTSSQQAVNDLAKQLQTSLAQRIEQRVLSYLDASQMLNQVHEANVSSGKLNLDDFADLQRYFWHQMKGQTQSNYFIYANRRGESLGIERKGPDDFVVKVRDRKTAPNRVVYALDQQGERIQKVLETKPFDPRSRPFYKAAVAAGKPTWSPIYVSFSRKVLRVDALTPIYTQDRKFQGVFSTEVTLEQINKFLNSLYISQSGEAFILERSGEIVASSTTELPFIKTATGEKRLLAAQSREPVIQTTSRQLIEKFKTLAQIQSAESFIFDLDGKRELVYVTPFHDGRGLDWLIVVVVPESDFMARIHANNRNTVALCVLALLIAIAAGLITARWITRPIQRVAQASEAIAQGALDQHILSSPIIEIEALAKSFNSMAGQLERSFYALAESEERFRSLVSNVPGAIYRSQCTGDPDRETWMMEFISDSIAAISGYPATDFTLNQIRTYDSIIHPDDREMQLGLVQQALANQETFTLEYRIQHRDGSIRWVHEQGRGIWGPEGNPIYRDGAIFDITAQQQAEEALRQSEATNRALVSSMPDLLIRMTGDGTHLGIISSDRLSVLNRELMATGNRNAYEILPHDLAERRMFYVRQAVETGEMQVYEQCIEVQGRYQYEEVRIVVVQGNEVLAIVRDITARKQAEEALQIANEELENRVEARTAELRAEKERSEQLLLNILPKPIAEQLKHSGESPAKHFEAATILFADIVGFTALAARMEPMELVNWLNQIFSAFDYLAEKHRLEKIKTIGDAYMVVGGLPVPRPDHAEAIANMALEMQACMSEFCNEYGESLQIRIGINTGPVIAGVIGVKKFIYDLWGDAVNIASRMESHGNPGSIQVTDAIYTQLKDKYLFEKRGAVAIKGRGEMTTYWLLGKA